jgi:hypothetical protein
VQPSELKFYTRRYFKFAMPLLPDSKLANAAIERRRFRSSIYCVQQSRFVKNLPCFM